jgi:PAS domain S-box-containing protein
MTEYRHLLLAQASHRIHAVATVADAARTVADEACAVVGAHMGVVRLPADARHPADVTAFSLSDKYARWWNFDIPPNGSGIYNHVCRTNRPMRLTQAQLERHPAWQGFGVARGQHPPLRGWLATPIVGSGARNLGVIHLSDRYVGEFSEADQAILGRLAGMAAVAIEKLHVAETRQGGDALLTAAFDNTSIGMSVADATGRLLRVNPAFCRIAGYGAAELMAMTIDQITHPEDRATERSRYKALHAGRFANFVSDKRLVRRNGEIVWTRNSVSATANEHSDRYTTVCLTEDVTEQRATENALAAAREETEEILRSISDAFYSLDRNWQFTYVNDAAEKLLRRSRSDLLGRNVWTEFPEARDMPIFEHFTRAMERKERVDFETYYPPLDSWFEVRVFPHERGLSVYFRNISHRIENEKIVARQQAESAAALARTRRIIASSLDIIANLDAEGRFIEISPRCRDIWGFEPEELIGRRSIELVHPDDRDRTVAEAEAIVRGQISPTFVNRYVRKDGGIVHMQWASSWSDEDQCCFAVGRDVTERIESEQRLRQSQRLEAVGQLTGGVAHDFNNLLMVILGTTELLMERTGSDRELHSLAETIAGAVERGSELTNRLLAFARRQALMPQIVDVTDLLERMGSVLGRTLGALIEIKISPSQRPHRALVDAGQLETAILNLAVNARDAMPEGGTLTIGARNVVLNQQDCANLPDATPGRYIAVSVTDTGTGMPEKVRSMAFEPFFTTKDVGKGTGLGLSMVYGFARQSGGHATIESRPDAGSTVTVFLPVAEESGEEHEGLRDKEDVSSDAGARILAVEDDDDVRTNVEILLTDMGYRVTAAASGREALAAFERDGPFDLLFTDVIMPGGMNGAQLAREIRRRAPDIALLFTSGYAENALADLRDVEDSARLLKKPYRRAELATAVQVALTERDA